MRTLVIALLWTGACAQQPALITHVQKTAAVRTLERELARSVDAEKSAVLATTDEESEAFALASLTASAQVEKARETLRTLANERELNALAAFDVAWAKVVEVDSRLLPLAVANSNLKANRLSNIEARAAVERVVSGLQKLGGESLSRASVAALRVQVLHAPHIASPHDAEMTALEGQIEEQEHQVDDALRLGVAKKGDLVLLHETTEAWMRFKALTAQVVALSRQNTNIISFELSIHEKRDATQACERALQALAMQVEAVAHPTR